MVQNWDLWFHQVPCVLEFSKNNEIASMNLLFQHDIFWEAELDSFWVLWQSISVSMLFLTQNNKTKAKFLREKHFVWPEQKLGTLLWGTAFFVLVTPGPYLGHWDGSHSAQWGSSVLLPIAELFLPGEDRLWLFMHGMRAQERGWGVLPKGLC